MSDFEPRRADPGQAFTWHDQWGKRHEFRADKEGVLQPRNAAQVAAADAFGLPVARKVAKVKGAKADEQAASTPDAAPAGGSD